jgi:hypothetical protein
MLRQSHVRLPVAGDDSTRMSLKRPAQIVEEVDRRHVGPVQVVDEQDDRPGAGDFLKERSQFPFQSAPDDAGGADVPRAVLQASPSSTDGVGDLQVPRSEPTVLMEGCQRAFRPDGASRPSSISRIGRYASDPGETVPSTVRGPMVPAVRPPPVSSFQEIFDQAGLAESPARRSTPRIRRSLPLTWVNARNRRPALDFTADRRAHDRDAPHPPWSSPGCELVSSRTTSSASGRPARLLPQHLAGRESSNARGMSRFNADGQWGTGSSVRMLAITPAEVGAVEWALPRRHFRRATMPSAKTSGRRACGGSGCLCRERCYAGVPASVARQTWVLAGLRRDFRIRLFPFSVPVRSPGPSRTRRGGS